MGSLLDSWIKIKSLKINRSALKKIVFGKLFHASPEGVKRMDELNKFANSGVLDCIFRLDSFIFNSFSQ